MSRASVLVEVHVDEATERDFTEFVAQRTHALFRVAYALTGDQHAAEDLLQNALAKAAMRWSRVEGDGEAYVKRILYRDCVSVWRWRSRRRETLMATLPDLSAHADVDPDLRMLLIDALRRLPPRQRAVLVLRYLDDMSEKQVAELLGCSPGTVGSQASRALDKLRRTVGPLLFPRSTAPEALK
jgi:RNA polymerase sigma-70 factor (sigma-E family)